ncbi:hypothetical protein L1987_17367 [Smallanthus sonchifolius]|uniref:Uncharacterized protein n=1 Tax=Smallanthus sonchifolius TaxID=185202 RepID=A0ACB9IXB7_9ASTR|nr:hypothetical protein L1987_17367 [Smallanthus sonchifolius]
MMRRKCRIWWPRHLSPLTQPRSSTFLFGWFISSSSSSSSASVPLEIVVAFSIDEEVFSSIGSDLEGILHKINKRMPTSLQNRCELSMLGYCSADSSSNGELPLHRESAEEYSQISVTPRNSGPHTEQNMPKDRSGHWICGCHKVDGFLDQYKTSTKSNPAQLVYGSYIYISRNLGWIPRLHHIHWDMQVASNLDLHVLIYGTPRFGGHHFYLGSQHSFEDAKTISRKPKWVEDLSQKKSVLDLDAVILATNCAAAATSFFEEQVSPKRPALWFRCVYMCITTIWQLLAVCVATVSTSIYIILQLLRFLLSSGSDSCIYATFENLFIHTWKNIRVRCCQILYWPIFLHNNDSRSESCVEYAEKASLLKHSMWLSVAIDMLFGNLFGLALLTHADSVCLSIFTITSDITNNWWLISCARLMGNPAGFKLNTELAGVLGTFSLNTIQIWSTLWGSMRFIFIFFIKGLAISGVLFGFTTPASLAVDLITVSTTHVSTLHWLISLIYSRQIQAITALWRLFRGQKWNPLRERWSISCLDMLPEYMKLIYKELLDVHKEAEDLLEKKGNGYRSYYTKEMVKEYTRNLLIEAKWASERYIPTVEEHMSVTMVTCAYAMIIAKCYVHGDDLVTEDTFKWVSTYPPIVKASCLILRLMDDIATHKEEQERNHVASSVECYMKQYGVSEEHTRELFTKIVEDSWKVINQESLRQTYVPRLLLMPPINLARVCDVLYARGDDYNHAGKEMINHIKSLLVNPISV